MAHRNVHQNKKSRTHKTVPAVKTVTPVSPIKQPVTAATAKLSGIKTPATQEAAAVRYAELPFELRRIALFSAFVVVLLLVLWFFLK
jgi:hypothetical protein